MDGKKSKKPRQGSRIGKKEVLERAWVALALEKFRRSHRDFREEIKKGG